MSAFSEELEKDVSAVTTRVWSSRDGAVIPETTDIKLSNDRVVLNASFLYADLADSTELSVSNKETAGEVYKSYLQGVSKLIRRNGGSIRSFDGDRVMGVFLGTSKNTDAARCGLQINWFFRNVLAPQFRAFYAHLASFQFAQTVGIDVGHVHVARGGVHAHNDLIWVGRAPNVSAKLSSIRQGYVSIFITQDVYEALHLSSKYSSLQRCGSLIIGRLTTNMVLVLYMDRLGPGYRSCRSHKGKRCR